MVLSAVEFSTDRVEDFLGFEVSDRDLVRTPRPLRCTIPADVGAPAVPFDCSNGRCITALGISSIYNFSAYLARRRIDP
jgi:hypothetical protein